MLWSRQSFKGDGSARVFRAGECFSLVDHPLYGANTTAFNYAGALTASRDRPDNAFCLVAVEHHAANNLGMQAATLLGSLQFRPERGEQGTLGRPRQFRHTEQR